MWPPGRPATPASRSTPTPRRPCFFRAELQGTARDFIADQKNADKFYACVFSRAGSTGPIGLHVTPLAPTGTEFCQRYGLSTPVPDMSTIRPFYRANAESTTKTRPALSELLLDRLLLFTPK